MSDDLTRQIDGVCGAFNRGDWEEIRRLVDADFELHDLETLPDADVYRGVDAFEDWSERLREQFESVEFLAANPDAVGDLIVTDMDAHAIGKGSGAEVELAFAAVWGFREGKPSYHRAYETRERALEAARTAAG